MLDYNRLYNRIVNILRRDYAGLDRPEISKLAAAHSKVTMMGGRGSDGLFFKEARDYIDELRDKNLRLVNTRLDGQRDYSRGFAARGEAGGALVVSELFGAQGPCLGDEITAIDGQSVADFRESLQAPRLYGEDPEREIWENTLRCAPSLALCRGGASIGRLRLPRCPPKPGAAPAIALARPGADTLLISLTGPVEREALGAFIAKHRTELRNCQRLLIDLRRCESPDGSDLFPLLPYACGGLGGFDGFLKEQALFVNYSQDNCALLLARYGEAQAGVGRDSEAGAFLQGLMEDVEAKRGAGFVEEENDSLSQATEFLGDCRAPGKCVILTDLYCRDGAELFAALMKRCGGARLAGRPSLGTMDYALPMAAVLDESASLIYPMAITRAAREGRGLCGRGLPVDLYIPYSREEAFEDVVLKRVLAAG